MTIHLLIVLSSWASKIILMISAVAGLSVAKRISTLVRQEHAFQRASGNGGPTRT